MDDLTKNRAVVMSQGGTPKGTPRTQIEQAYDAVTAVYDTVTGVAALDYSSLGEKVSVARELVRRAAVHDAQREVAGLSAYNEAGKARRSEYDIVVRYQRTRLHLAVAQGVIVGLVAFCAIVLLYSTGVLS